jgi:hypothetical protein
MKTSYRRTWLTSIALAALASLQGEALAHTLLTNPAPVTNNDNAKSGPCGCEFGGDPACPAGFPNTDLVAGETILVAWKETVNHNGSFRLAFAPKPVDQVTGAELDANVLYDQADNNSIDGATISESIVVPDTPCTACTLQLRQFMDGAANPYYYSCASVRILPAEGMGGAGGAGGSSSGSGAGGNGSGGGGQGGDGTGEDDSTGAGLATPPPRIDTGGACSVGGGDRSGSALGFLALGALAVAGAARRGRLARKAGRSSPR